MQKLPPAPAPVKPGDWWFNLRNRLLVSPVFQRWASAFVLTRPIAQARAASLFDLVAGFVYSQILLACVRLDVFERVAEGARSVPELAQAMGLAEAPAERLLAGAASLRLLERRPDGRYGLGVLGAPMVGNEALRSLVEHHVALYGDLADPVALLRERSGSAGASRLGAYWAYAGAESPGALPQAEVATYSRLMAASQPLVAGEVLDAYPMDRHRCLMDIGGGDGTFLRQAAARAAHLQVMLFDLPAVAERAREHFAQAGLADRARVAGGDFHRDPLPSGADLISLVRVVYDHDDASAQALMRAAYTALEPGGTLLLAEPMAGTPGAQAMGDAYFGLYLLAMGSGRPRTASELAAMLTRAGFEEVRQIPTRMPLQTRLMAARKKQHSQV